MFFRVRQHRQVAQDDDASSKSRTKPSIGPLPPLRFALTTRASDRGPVRSKKFQIFLG
jgi:hypothetical protein